MNPKRAMIAVSVILVLIYLDIFVVVKSVFDVLGLH